MFTLPNVTLRRGRMEDPHDMLVPLWKCMSMAGGGCLQVCGDACSRSRAHYGLMVSLSVRFS